MSSIQRLNYFTSQFLEEKDFQDEQAYHREMRHRHNRSLHTPGVVEGLEVSKVGDRQISVSPGMAIDRDGQEMILLADSGAISPSGAIALSGAKTDVFVTIQYEESKEEPDTTSGVGNQFRRIEEKPVIAFSNSNDSSAILLAIVTLDNSGTIVDKPNNQVKTMATAKVASKAIGTDQIGNGAVTREKIAPKAIGPDQLDDGSVRSNAITPQAVGTPQLTNLAVTTEKVASKAIGTDQIADGAVTASKIASKAIGSEQLGENSVTAIKIVNDTIDESKLTPVVKDKLSMGVVASPSTTLSIEFPSNAGFQPIELATATIQATTKGQVVITGNVRITCLVPPPGIVIAPDKSKTYIVRVALLDPNSKQDVSQLLINSSSMMGVMIPVPSVTQNTEIPFSITRVFQIPAKGTFTYKMFGGRGDDFPAKVLMGSPHLTAIFIPG